ncbi:hypothetical protein K32_11100 [Kaistia sp. 32K]|nr:hypothetical protein K32_11100 [Kaistia sp. 32K]
MSATSPANAAPETANSNAPATAIPEIRDAPSIMTFPSSRTQNVRATPFRANMPFRRVACKRFNK